MDPIIEYYAKHVIPLAIIFVLLTSINMRRQSRTSYLVKTVPSVSKFEPNTGPTARMVTQDFPTL